MLFWLCEPYYEVLFVEYGVLTTMDYRLRDTECMAMNWYNYAILYLHNLLEILHAGVTGLRTPLLHRPPVSLHIFTLALDRPELDCYSVLRSTPEYHGFRIVTD